MKILIPALLTAVLFMACGNASEQQPSTETATTTQSAQLETSEAFKSSFDATLDAYFELKDALVLTDADRAGELAAELTSRIQSVSTDELNADAAALWNGQGVQAGEAAALIVDEADVETQRLHFETVSNAYIEMVKAYGPFDNVIYRQTCPMVRGGSADWLSKEERVMNPYHGDRMLNCGSVVERI